MELVLESQESRSGKKTLFVYSNELYMPAYSMVSTGGLVFQAPFLQ